MPLGYYEQCILYELKESLLLRLPTASCVTEVSAASYYIPRIGVVQRGQPLERPALRFTGCTHLALQGAIVRVLLPIVLFFHTYLPFAPRRRKFLIIFVGLRIPSSISTKRPQFLFSSIMESSISIPVELLARILAYLPKDAIKQCCLANSVFLSLGQQKLFSAVSIPAPGNVDSSFLLEGRGREHVVRHTREILVRPCYKKFFKGGGAGSKRTQLLLSLIKEIGKNLRFLGIVEYEDVLWSHMNSTLIQGLFQHVVPYVQVLCIHGISRIPLSTIVSSAHNLSHLRLESWSFLKEAADELGSGVLPNLQKLTITLSRKIYEESKALSLPTLLEANSGTLRVLRLTSLDDENSISLWPVLHPLVEQLVYILDFACIDIAHPDLPPPTLPNLYVLQYYLEGVGYDTSWPATMSRIRRHILVQPSLRLVEIHLNGPKRGWIEFAISQMEDIEVNEKIEMNIFIKILGGDEDIVRLVKEKYSHWIVAGRMQIFHQLNNVDWYIDLDI
ncbi:hypothetical protein DL96DRAFT_1806401 [Flagelloscypha sp. PMI_526]|nr:hypothetical protein DL96DRAFT_1806401 [Flagelloscypha sp. PMI_526]